MLNLNAYLNVTGETKYLANMQILTASHWKYQSKKCYLNLNVKSKC